MAHEKFISMLSCPCIWENAIFFFVCDDKTVKVESKTVCLKAHIVVVIFFLRYSFAEMILTWMLTTDNFCSSFLFSHSLYACILTVEWIFTLFCRCFGVRAVDIVDTLFLLCTRWLYGDFVGIWITYSANKRNSMVLDSISENKNTIHSSSLSGILDTMKPFK